MSDYERCHFILIKGKYAFIPECMGGAARGPEGCTCLKRGARIRVLERRVETLQRTVRLLEGALERNGITIGGEVCARVKEDWIQKQRLSRPLRLSPEEQK